MSRFAVAQVGFAHTLSGLIPVAATDHAGGAFIFGSHAHGVSVVGFPRFSFRGPDSTSSSDVTNITDSNLHTAQTCLPAVLGDVTVSKVPFARFGVVECAVSAGVGINWHVARDLSEYLVARTALR